MSTGNPAAKRQLPFGSAMATSSPLVYAGNRNVVSINERCQGIRMEVASSRPDCLPTLSAANTSKLSLLVKHHILAIDEAS